MGPRIVIAGGGTGGHLYPALNLASALRRHAPAARVVLVGSRRGIEAGVLPDQGFEYRLLPLEPLYRSRPWRNWRLVGAIPRTVAGLRRLFREMDPQLVIGTGGYASGPAVAYARLTGRRTALQEQNALPGLVTRWLAPHVDQIHLGYPEARRRLRPGSGTRVFAYGNPVAAPEHASPGVAFPWPEGRTVAVLGGSQGARSINERLMADLAEVTEWPSDTWLVWVTGPAHHEDLSRRVSELLWSSRIRLVPFIPDLGAQLAGVTVAVSRAGAMFCSELAAAGVPAVLVPLPTAAADHQRHNAVALSEAGAAVMLEEGSMSSGDLWAGVVRLLEEEGRLAAMSRAMRQRGKPDAADRIAVELLRLLTPAREDPGAGD